MLTFVQKIVPHGSQKVYPRSISKSPIAITFIERAQQGSSTRSTALTLRIRKFEIPDIRDISRGLRIVTSTDHGNLRGNRFFGLAVKIAKVHFVFFSIL
jgi:hypothetical protein